MILHLHISMTFNWILENHPRKIQLTQNTSRQKIARCLPRAEIFSNGHGKRTGQAESKGKRGGWDHPPTHRFGEGFWGGGWVGGSHDNRPGAPWEVACPNSKASAGRSDCKSVWFWVRMRFRKFIFLMYFV